MYDDSTVLNQFLLQGMKIGGELAKTALLAALEKIKENKQNRVGLISLEELLKSKDELGLIKISKEKMLEFEKSAKELGVVFASVRSKDSDEVKILYKCNQVNQVKECLAEMLEHEAGNNLDEMQEKAVYDAMDENLDFPGVNDGYYRHEVDNMTNEKSIMMSDLLIKNGINNDIVVTEVNEGDTFKINFRVDEKHKDKVMEILETNKNKTVEELSEMLMPTVVNLDEIGLNKYGVEVNIEKYQDKWGKEKETFSMNLGDKTVNHALDEKHYSTISDTLKKLHFSDEQINELKEEDPFVKERVGKEKYYEEQLNKSNKGKECLDDLVKKASNKAKEEVKKNGKSKNLKKTMEKESER